METPSPVAGAALVVAKLPEITDETWEMHCDSVRQKQVLMDYAASRQIAVHEASRNDGALIIATTFHIGCLMSFGSGAIDSNALRLTPAQFVAMCDAYAARFV